MATQLSFQNVIDKSSKLMDAVFMVLNSNKLFTGLAMLVMNLGSRYIIMDIGTTYDNVFNSVVIKQIIVFCMIFASTRDVKLAIIMTFAFWFIVMGLLDKRRPLNVMPSFLGLPTKGNEASEVNDFAKMYSKGIESIVLR